MTSIYISKLGLITYKKMNVDKLKIDGSILVTYEIIMVSFLFQNKLRKIWFCKKTFLLANTNMKVVFRISFLIIFNTNIWYMENELIWRCYITIDILSITKTIEFFEKREFITIVLNKNTKIFEIYIIFLKIMIIHLVWKIEIFLLQVNKILTKIEFEYYDYVDIFFFHLIIELLEYNSINNHIIKLKKDK